MSAGRPRVGLVDYGTGNYASVRNALEHVGCRVDPLSSAAEVAAAERIILPGVGAFGACMRRLRQKGLADAIRARLDGETPFLGICVGMQMLASVGREFGDNDGLGYIAGEVRKIEAAGLRLPHVGWNAVRPTAASALFEGVGEAPTFYFVHSFELVPDDPGAVLARCEYGGSVTAGVQRGLAYGVQFHPEKSQAAGLRLLRNFATADLAALTVAAEV